MTTVLLKMQSTLLLFVWDAAAQREPALHEVKIELLKYPNRNGGRLLPFVIDTRFYVLEDQYSCFM